MTNEKTTEPTKDEFLGMTDKAAISKCLRDTCVSAYRLNNGPMGGLDNMHDKGKRTTQFERIIACAHALAELEHGVGNRV